MNKVLMTICIIAIVAGLGCAALSSYITPADVDKNALRYAINAGVAELDDYNSWYPNLAEAERLAKDVDTAHTVNQFELQQLIQKDDLDYSIHKGVVADNYNVAKQREQQLFGEKGLLSMGLGLLGFGGFTGLIGLMRKRPGDITSIEMEQALATATGKTTEELTAKQKQMIQIVKGIEEFAKTFTPEMKAQFKLTMNQAQDTETQIAVQTIKKSV